jgi:hypothetical protein
MQAALIKGRPSSGDEEQDLRRQERWAFDVLMRSMDTLAGQPHEDSHRLEMARARVHKAKRLWAIALRELDALQ